MYVYHYLQLQFLEIRGGDNMAHHYKSHCKQCYAYKHCSKVEERMAYVAWWNKNGQPIGMGNHDCFASPEEFEKSLKSKQNLRITYCKKWRD